MQSELEIQVKKLNEKTHKDFEEMLREATERAAQLTDVFKSDNEKQGKEFHFIEMQADSLTEDHHKMKEASSEMGLRTSEIETKVGV